MIDITKMIDNEIASDDLLTIIVWLLLPFKKSVDKGEGASVTGLLHPEEEGVGRGEPLPTVEDNLGPLITVHVEDLRSL